MDGRIRKAVLFPGQGSQYVGMGREFMENDREAMEIILLGESITGLPLLDAIYKGPPETLTRTLICQPAVFGIDLVCWHILKKRLNLNPDAFAGHSLGEYAGLVASGAVDMEQGFHLVSRRAEIMDEISAGVDGSMLAIIGLDADKAVEMINSFPGAEVANINSSSQVIAGGAKDDLKRFSDLLKGEKIKNIFLKVSGPFHTSCMEPASLKLREIIDDTGIRDAAVPLYMNFSGEKVTAKEQIKENLVRQLYSPVRWVDTLKNIYESGDTLFIEAGPGRVLKKLVESTLPGSFVLNVEDEDSLASAVDSGAFGGGY